MRVSCGRERSYCTYTGKAGKNGEKVRLDGWNRKQKKRGETEETKGVRRVGRGRERKKRTGDFVVRRQKENDGWPEAPSRGRLL